jgi:serine/threonine protein kinase
MPSRPGLELARGHRLLTRLGQGGFGEVWEAESPGGFRVALKFVPLGGRLGESDARSLNLLRDLRHPHLLTIFEAFHHGGYLVLAMERADRTLWDRYREVRDSGMVGIPRDELLHYLGQAALALDYLNSPGHAFGDGTRGGVQHRDDKPHNLLLFQRLLKVGDFGLARLVRGQLTGHSGGLTAPYAPPEFFRGKTSDRSDQYALAVTYCLLRGGRLPFPGSADQVMAGHLTRQPDLTMLPAEERPAVARALAKHPPERWDRCIQFAVALGEVPGPVADKGLVAGAIGTGGSQVAAVPTRSGAPTTRSQGPRTRKGQRPGRDALAVRVAKGPRKRAGSTRLRWAVLVLVGDRLERR